MNNIDFHQDWMFLKLSLALPEEIIDFMESVFQIFEARERIDTVKGIRFEIRPRENNHPLPHIHAEYDGYNISIAIDTAKILAGNLPHKQEKVATEWVKKHKDQLLGKWNDIAVSGTAMYTKSGIGTLEE